MASMLYSSSSACKVFLLVFALSASTSCNGSPTFLGGSKGAELEVALLAEIARNFGHGPASAHVSKLEALLSSTYATLPKNKNGKLGHVATRFALRRFFSQQHSWRISGLESSNTSSPDVVLKERVPSHVQNLFEQRLAGQGLDLHELAILAATLERIANDEASESLADIYTGYEIGQDQILATGGAEQVIHSYLSLLVYNMSALDQEDFNKTARYAALPVGHDLVWDDMRMWATDVWGFDRYVQRDSRNPFKKAAGINFDEVAAVVGKIGSQYGQWQSRYECHVLKNALMEIEDAGTGRIRLPNYYAYELSGSLPEPFHFDERVELLRDLDALDETDPASPKIIISNYVTAATNCHFSSFVFYEICCTNECEALMDHLERKIASTGASPSIIAGVVANLPSDTVSAPWNLSSSMLQRLDQIAGVNGGLVPIHGRLFAQWMHHAYPRECPYPQSHGVAGTLTPEHWAESGSGVMSEAAMLKLAENNATDPSASSFESVDATEDQGQWDYDEESLLVDVTPVEESGIFKVSVRSVMYLALLGSFLLVAVQTLLSSLSSAAASTEKTSLLV